MKESFLRESFVEVGGIKTQYFTGGSGPTLLLIHGWPLCFHLPSELLETAALNFKVFAVNLPGFGRTELPNFLPTINNYAKHLYELAQVLGIGEHAVIGWSLGGMIAIKYAAINQKEITRLVLCGTAASGREVANQFLRQAYRCLGSLVEKILKSEKLLSWIWDRISPDDKSKKNSISDLQQIPTLLTKQIFDSGLKTNLVKECRFLKDVPTLILSGEKDNLMTVKAGSHLDQLIGTSCFLIVPHAWHWDILNQDSIRVVIDFLMGKSRIKNNA